MKKKYQFILFTIALFLSGCYGQYKSKGKCCEIISKKYRLNEPILLKNYVIYNTMDFNNIVSSNSMMWQTDFDSLINVFGSALNKLKLPVINKSYLGDNFTEFYHIEKPPLRFIKFDDDWIVSVVNLGDTQILSKMLPDSSLILLPVVYLYNTVNFTGFMSSGGVAGDNGFFVHTYFYTMVYMIKNEQIVYKKFIRYKSEKSQNFNTRQEAVENAFAPMIKQEHWDEIVRLVMNDYVKRLK